VAEVRALPNPTHETEDDEADAVAVEAADDPPALAAAEAAAEDAEDRAVHAVIAALLAVAMSEFASEKVVEAVAEAKDVMLVVRACCAVWMEVRTEVVASRLLLRDNNAEAEPANVRW